MGDNRSNVCLGLSGVVVRFAFASLLLSSVCFPSEVLANNIGINDGTDLRTALLDGTWMHELGAEGVESSTSGFSIPNPGQEFIKKGKHHKTWLKTNSVDLDFMGEVAFQNAHFIQRGTTELATDPWVIVDENGELILSLEGYAGGTIWEAPKENYVTTFYGGALHNGANTSFTGTSISFKNNKIDSATHWKEAEHALDTFSQGAAVYNSGVLTVSSDTRAAFDSNIVIAGTTKTGGETNHFANAAAQGGALFNKGLANFEGESSFSNNIVTQKWIHTGRYYDSKKGETTYDAWSLSDGGAIYNEKDIVFSKSVTFVGNRAENGTSSRGGAIYNAGVDNYNVTGQLGSTEPVIPTIHFKGNASFAQNIATTKDFYAYGGGIANMKGHIVFDGITTFSANEAILEDEEEGLVVAGAGLYNLGRESSATFNGTTYFLNNKVKSYDAQSSGNGAGVYLSDGIINFNGGAVFAGNSIDAQANIKETDGTLTPGLSYGEGGAMQVLGTTAVATFKNNASFEGNSVVASSYAVGGALVNYGTTNFEGNSTIQFKGNSVKNMIAENDYSNEELLQNNIHFIQGRGGALYNAEGNTTFGPGTDVTFEGNKALSEKAKGYGGAVYNEVFANDTGRVNFYGTTTFKNNEATTGGGAIFNKGVMELGGKTTFTGNKAQLGGAIYNDAGALMTISGSNVAFKNNIAELGSNIYNLGTVNIQGVEDTMAIEYEPYTNTPYPSNAHTLLDQSGDIYNAGTLNINRSNLHLVGINTKQTTDKTIGTISITDSIVDLGLNTIYTDIFNVNNNSKVIAHVGENVNGQVVAGSNINISGQGTSLQVIVDIDELQKGEAKEYQLFKVAPDANTPSTTGEGTTTSSTGISGAFSNIAENYLYSITEKEGEKGVYIVERGSGSSSNQNGSGSTNNPVVKPTNPHCPSGDCDNYNKEASDAWIDGGVIEENEEAQFVRTQLHALAQEKGLDSQDYQDAMNQITPDTSTLITAHANEVTRQISNAISKRFYSSIERSHYVYNGKVHYKAPRQTSNVWVDGIYGQSEYSGKNKWDMDTMGVAAGIEAKLTKTLKVGAMIAYTTGDGSTSSRDTEIETTAGAVYAEYSPSRFYANAFALYGSSKVKEERSVFSKKVESEFDVNIIAAQAIAGYKLGPVVFGNWVSGVISPEAGFRYVYAKQKEYTDTLGQTVEGTDSHTLTGVLGAKYTLGYRLSPSMWMYPELRAALTYDFITPTMDTNVVLLNGASYTYETEEMDRFGVEIGVKMGLEIDKRTEIGLEYEGLFKGDYTNHTGVANVKYHF